MQTDHILLNWSQGDLEAKTSQYLESYGTNKANVEVVDVPIVLSAPNSPRLIPISTIAIEKTESSPLLNMRTLATTCVANLKKSEEPSSDPQPLKSIQVQSQPNDSRMLLNPRNVKNREYRLIRSVKAFVSIS